MYTLINQSSFCSPFIKSTRLSSMSTPAALRAIQAARQGALPSMRYSTQGIVGRGGAEKKQHLSCQIIPFKCSESDSHVKSNKTIISRHHIRNTFHEAEPRQIPRGSILCAATGNGACHPDDLHWEYCPDAISLCQLFQVTKSSIELQWLDNNERLPGLYPSKGRQAACPIPSGFQTWRWPLRRWCFRVVNYLPNHNCSHLQYK